MLSKNSLNSASPPEIRVLGDGSGALVVPVIEDGKIIQTIILDSGSGYNPNNTFVQVVPNRIKCTIYCAYKIFHN